jgi:hypothetical protein
MRALVVMGTSVAATLAGRAASAEARPGHSAAIPAPAPVALPESVSTPAQGSVLSRNLSFLFGDTLRGRSGKLLARFVAPPRDQVVTGSFTVSALRRLFGDTAVERPGVYAVRDSATSPFAFITMLPFAQKVNGRIGEYRMGFWPAEARSARSNAYQNPSGFIRVTREMANVRLSEHFRLGDFLTHDQQQVWPKYLVLREPLLDKLELVVAELRREGHDVRALHVMSGFRTPQYNVQGVGAGGRAQDSRHQYGDAADVWVENGAGRMADLNRDGRVDTRDAAVLANAAEQVERAHPELIGGIGIYRANSAHGPFVHIDVRGTRARWGNA